MNKFIPNDGFRLQIKKRNKKLWINFYRYRPVLPEKYPLIICPW